ncbi:MAG: hypothetical protein M5R42_00505 [Rhodocyclaceae bacterium]|nr:hypothetical protein [Rhodocyclaceae bacterium]
MDYRITAGKRSDSGFENFNDSRKLEYVAFRGDLRLNPRDELQLHVGASRNSNGAGFAGSQATRAHARGGRPPSACRMEARARPGRGTQRKRLTTCTTRRRKITS